MNDSDTPVLNRDGSPADPAAAADTAQRRLCICADDFGLHPAVNEAVGQLVAMGRLQATSAMVGAPAWTEGARMLAQVDPAHLDVGLHLDLTEYPLTVAPRSLAGWLLQGPRDVPALLREVHAQLDRFEAALDRMPAYVDGHQHVHQFPGVRDALLTALTARYPGHHPWLRSTRPGSGGFKPRVIDALGRRGLEHHAEALDFDFNRRLLGVYGFDGDAGHYRQQVEAWLRQAGDRDLLMCHPAIAQIPGDAIAAARCQEFLVWSDPTLWSSMSAGGLQFLPMSRMLRS